MTHMHKIVLVNPPNDKTVLRDMYSSTISKGLYNWPNADLLTLSAVLKPHANVFILDANTLKLSQHEALGRITAEKPSLVVAAVGASVKNDDYAFIRSLKKALPETKIAGTGGILYHNGKAEMEDLPELDACLTNFTTKDIVHYLTGDYAALSHIVYRHPEKGIVTPEKKPTDKNFIIGLPSHDDLPLGGYGLSHGRNKPLTSMITSFGCPGKCSFCVAGKIPYSIRDVNDVMREIRHVKGLGVKEIFFRDNAFADSAKKGAELLQAMIRENAGMSFVSDMRASAVSPEKAVLLNKAGCHALHIGVESASQSTLDAYHKKVKIREIENAFSLLKKNGILTMGYFILGLPGETENDVMNTIRFAIDLDCDYASFNIPIPIFGTDLRKEAEDKGWLKKDADIYDGSSEAKIGTGLLDDSRLNALQKTAYKRFYFRPRYFKKALMRIRTPYQLRMLVSEFLMMTLKKK